jgi:hypothetical protein
MNPMADTADHTTIGELATRYSDAKRKRTRLIAGINASRQAIGRFERVLQHIDTAGLSARTVPKVTEGYPSREAIETTLNELRSACEEIERTHGLLKDAGVEVS